MLHPTQQQFKNEGMWKEKHLFKSTKKKSIMKRSLLFLFYLHLPNKFTYILRKHSRTELYYEVLMQRWGTQPQLLCKVYQHRHLPCRVRWEEDAGLQLGASGWQLQAKPDCWDSCNAARWHKQVLPRGLCYRWQQFLLISIILPPPINLPFKVRSSNSPKIQGDLEECQWFTLGEKSK